MNPYQNIWGKIICLPVSTKLGSFIDIGEPNIGENCTIQAFVSIPPGWKIGNNVFIGPGVHFANDKYPKAQGKWDIYIGEVKDNVSIGMGALIGAGVTIGEGAVIGQGTNVLKDIPPYEVWVGNPASFIQRVLNVMKTKYNKG